MKKILCLTGLLALICTFAFGQKWTRGIPDAATADFIDNATRANLEEIAAGKLAGTMGHSPSVKAYGDKMVDHHHQATKRMMAIIKAKHIKIAKPLPEEVAPDSSLITASGPEFDRLYVTMMVEDHRKAVALFQNAASNLPDPDLRLFAAKTLPMLKEHLAEIIDIAKQLNITLP